MPSGWLIGLERLMFKRNWATDPAGVLPLFDINTNWPSVAGIQNKECPHIATRPQIEYGLIRLFNLIDARNRLPTAVLEASSMLGGTGAFDEH